MYFSDAAADRYDGRYTAVKTPGAQGGIAAQRNPRVAETVTAMLARIRSEGLAAVAHYATELDGYGGQAMEVPREELEQSGALLPTDLRAAIDLGAHRTRVFAQASRNSLSDLEIEVEPGLVAGFRYLPVQRVGAYLPAGRFPLTASALMTINVAKAAGVPSVIACTPPQADGKPNAAVLYAAYVSGVDRLFVLGGVQALAAMAYGLLGEDPVDMLVGAGNAFVAEAKRQLFGTVAIDLLAGPSEVAVLADHTADPELVAADLLGQAEHGPDSPAALITTSGELAHEVVMAVDRQLATLATADIAGPAWRDHGSVTVAADRETAAALMDDLAPEHLEVQTADDAWYHDRLTAYGSLFLGAWSTVAYSDKGMAGTNHVLPTAGGAQHSAGLSVSRFLRALTYQRVSAEATPLLADAVAVISASESMEAHRMTAELRTRRFAHRDTELAASLPLTSLTASHPLPSSTDTEETRDDHTTRREDARTQTRTADSRRRRFLDWPDRSRRGDGGPRRRGGGHSREGRYLVLPLRARRRGAGGLRLRSSCPPHRPQRVGLWAGGGDPRSAYRFRRRLQLGVRLPDHRRGLHHRDRPVPQPGPRRTGVGQRPGLAARRPGRDRHRGSAQLHQDPHRHQDPARRRVTGRRSGAGAGRVHLHDIGTWWWPPGAETELGLSGATVGDRRDRDRCRSGFGFLAFAGFEGAATLGEETQNPKRDVPRAIVIALAVVACFYLVGIVAQSLGYGTSDAGVQAFLNTPSAYGELANMYVGKPLAIALNLAAALSSIAITLGTMNASARILYATGRGAGDTKVTTRLSRKGEPVAALLITLGVAAVIMTGQRLAGSTVLNACLYWLTIGAISLLVAYALATAGAMRFLFLRRVALAPRWQIVIPVLGLLFIAYVIYRNAVGVPAPYDRFPLIVGGFLVLATLIAAVVPGLADRVRRTLADEVGLAAQDQRGTVAAEAEAAATRSPEMS